MGSPISAVVANLNMEFFEELPLEMADVSSPEEEQEKGPLVVIPYVAGMSEDIRRVCRKFNIRVVFKSGRTLHLMLTKVKDTLPPGKQSNVVYHIPCSCG